MSNSTLSRTISCIKNSKLKQALENSSVYQNGKTLHIEPKTPKDAETVCSLIEKHTHGLAKELGIDRVSVSNSRLIRPFVLRCCSERI